MVTIVLTDEEAIELRDWLDKLFDYDDGVYQAIPDFNHTARKLRDRKRRVSLFQQRHLPKKKLESISVSKLLAQNENPDPD